MRIFLILLTPIFTAGALCFGVMPGLQQVAMVVFGLRARDQTARFHSRGVLLAALSHFAWFPLFAAASAVLPHDSMGVVGAAACASFIHAVILAPYALFVPAHLTLPAPEPGMMSLYPMPNLDRALAQWDRLSWTWRVALLTARVVPVVASFALFFVCRQWLSWRISFTLASFAYGFGVFAYAEAAAAAHVKTWKLDEVPVASARYLVLPALTCTLLGLVLFAYGLIAATEPSPMAHYRGPQSELGMLEIGDVLYQGQLSNEGVTLPGTDIHLSGAVSVETADGGGAGNVAFRSPYERQPSGAQYAQSFPNTTMVEEHADGFTIYHRHQDAWRYFTINRAGIRTDDALARRLRHGVGLGALSLFATGLLLIMLSVWLLASAARVRRRLGALSSVEELDSAECIGSIQGTFHGRALNVSGIEGRMIIQVKGSCEVRGHLGGSILRFRLPASGTRSIGLPLDGQPVTLTGVFPKLQAQLRDPAVDWPNDALLLAGDKDKVAAGLMRRAVRPALFALGLAGAVWASALITLFAHRF